MRLGKVSSWSALLNTFEESCALCNSMLLSGMEPPADALDDAGFRLLSCAELAPRASGAADAAAFIAPVSPRSIAIVRLCVAPWRRWREAMRSSDARVDVESEVLMAPPRDATDMACTNFTMVCVRPVAGRVKP